MVEQTLGEKRVRVDSDLTQGDVASLIKQKTADLINLLQNLKAEEASRTYSETPEKKQEFSGEVFRVIALAQTEFESACHWAVKAATAGK